MSRIISVELHSTYELAERMVPFFNYTSLLIPELNTCQRKLEDVFNVSLSLHELPALSFHFSAQVSWLFEGKQWPCVVSLLPEDVATGHRLRYLTHQHKAEYGKLFDGLLNSCLT